MYEKPLGSLVDCYLLLVRIYPLLTAYIASLCTESKPVLARSEAICVLTVLTDKHNLLDISF